MEYRAAVVVAVLLAGLLAIQSVGGETLGLTNQQVAWFGIISAVLGCLASILPPVHQRPEDPPSDPPTFGFNRRASLQDP